MLIREGDITGVVVNCRHGMWYAKVPLMRKGASKNRHNFGHVEFTFYDDVAGRFTDLLGMQPADTEGTGPLH